MPLDNAAFAPTPSRIWRVEMLGRLRAVEVQSLDSGTASASRSVEQFRTHKAALLLAYLALFPDRTHARDELADLFWPDMPSDRGRANLSLTLVHLRQALGQKSSELFIGNHKTIGVAKNALQSDAALWEAAAQTALTTPNDRAEATALVRAALAAYSGDLLPGFYDGWVSDERARLGEIHNKLQARLCILEAASLSTAFPESKTTATPSETGGNDEPFFVNAPLFLTRFFGRETECAEICDLLGQNPPVRLVTLLGMGGIGKTRIAVEAARSLACGTTPVFGGAAFIPLDQARTANDMESILLSMLPVEPGADGIAAAAKYLNARTTNRCLLVLDNLEQLGEASAPVVGRLLALVPRLTVLATSRQPVGVAGEQEMPLGPLHNHGASETGEMPNPAVRLFVDRARLVRPSFALSVENTSSVFRLCELLEGVPLALELAGAWARIWTPLQMVARLNNRFDLLRGGQSSDNGMVPKRHQSLHAAIAWSYDLLGPNLQQFWAQLSVFRGGWTDAAAQAATNVKEVSQPLLLLAERSLIVAEADEITGEVRYRMLESLREFAHEQAIAMGDEPYAALCLRHAQYFEELSREADTLIETGRGTRPALALLGPERDNLRGIVACLQNPSAGQSLTIEAALHVLMHTGWLWPVNEIRGYLSLAALAAEYLPEETGLPLQAGLLTQSGLYSKLAGDRAAAEVFLRDGLALWETLQNRERVFAAKKFLASVVGNRAEAIALWKECLGFAEETDNPHLEAAILNNLANEGQDLVHLAQRRAWIEQAVCLDRKHASASHFLACSLNSMGCIAFEQNDVETARQCLEEAHAIATADGAVGMMGVTKMSLAGLFCDTGESFGRALRLLHEAEVLFEEKNEPPRIAEVHLLRFRLAVKSGDLNAAVRNTHDYLRVSGETGLLDAEALASAQADMAGQLQTAGGLSATPTIL